MCRCYIILYIIWSKIYAQHANKSRFVILDNVPTTENGSSNSESSNVISNINATSSGHSSDRKRSISTGSKKGEGLKNEKVDSSTRIAIEKDGADTNEDDSDFESHAIKRSKLDNSQSSTTYLDFDSDANTSKTTENGQ